MNGLSNRLCDDLNPHELVELLTTNTNDRCLQKPSSESLEVFTNLLQSKKIPTFISNEDVITAIARFVSTPAGLGCITSYLSTCAVAEIEPIVRVIELALTLDDLLLSKFLSSSRQEAINLLLGSRILNAVAAKTNIESWVGSSEKYSSWLSFQFMNAKLEDSIVFDRALKLGAPQHFIDPMLLHNMALLKSNWDKLRSTQQRFALQHGLIPLLPRNPPQAGKLLIDLNVDSHILASICSQTLPDISIIRGLVLLAQYQKKTMGLIQLLIREWCDSVYIAKSPLIQQQNLTQIIVALSCVLPKNEAQIVSMSEDMINGVNNHLSSSSVSIRNMGTLVAELLAKQAGSKLEFGINYSDYDWWIGVDEVDSSYKYTKDAPLGPDDKTKPANTSSSSNHHLASILEPRGKIEDSDDEEEVFGDEADSDEEVEQAYYLKDLLEYLRSDSYAQVTSALLTGPRLIKQKANFGSEVSQYANDLLQATCSMTDKFSIKNFAELRQTLLNSIIISEPSQASRVCYMFSTGDWSLSQRQSLLVSLANAAHVLANGDDEVTQDDKLPDAVHRLFISNPQHESNAQLRAASQRGLIDSPSLTSGTITRRSRNLERKTPEGTQTNKNKFSKIASTFFFPLLNARPPLRPVSYDSIIFSQWLRTLGVIVAEAYPSNSMPDMVCELWELLKNVLTSRPEESVILEAIYSDVIILAETGAAILLQSFPSDLGIVYDLIANTFADSDNGEISPQTALLGRASLSQLAKLLQSLTTKIAGNN